MTRSRPLPGVRIEGRAVPLPEALPRMDIAVFVGFAASGPLHRPVAVEDAEQFAMLFGADLALPAGDAALAPCVRTFFRNGGRRCWIVRVADETTARANTFTLPGIGIAGGGDAIAQARSEGSWSDALRVSTTLTPVAVRATKVEADAITIDPVSLRDVVVGDLLRVEDEMHFFVEAIEGNVLHGGGQAILPVPPVDPEDGQAGLPGLHKLTFELTVRDGDRIWQLGGLGFAPQHPRYWAALPTDDEFYEDSAEFIEGLVTFRPKRSALWGEAAYPRFPLAGIARDKRYIPTTKKVVRSKEVGTTFDAPALVRNGLTKLASSLFIDEELGGASVYDLVDRATYVRYEVGRKLRGIHAALAIEEATMIAVPDAVQHPWKPAGGGELPAPAPPEEKEKKEKSGTFFDCTPGAPVPVPTLIVTGPAKGAYMLEWAAVENATDELLEALRPDFSDEIVYATSTTGTVEIQSRTAGSIFYYRVRRTVEGESVLSNALVVHVVAAEGFTLEPEYDASVLVATHKALATMAAARGDLVALLSLPRHYDEPSAIVHADTLRRDPALSAQTLSYAALAHPWVIARDEATSALRAVPPDGGMAGVMALRASRRGAWIAPANEPLRGALALTPAIASASLQALQDAGVNVVRHETNGFVLLDSDTLSDDDDVRALNVRRLLILVRRAALRVGNRYVFEPNGTTTRLAVRRAFESMLESMFVEGAFAGRTSRSAFQVVIDDSDAASREADQGRLIAELRIAPARPLSFLTVRLLQSGGTLTAREGR